MSETKQGTAAKEQWVLNVFVDGACVARFLLLAHALVLVDLCAQNCRDVDLGRHRLVKHIPCKTSKKEKQAAQPVMTRHGGTAARRLDVTY